MFRQLSLRASISILLLVAVSSGRAADTASLPPGEPAAKETLDKSSRHGEFVKVAVPGSDAPVNTFVVYPEVKEKAPVVIVIFEIFGMTDWIRSVADQLAKDGFIAVAPDLLSGKGPDGKDSSSVPNRGDAMKLVGGLQRPEIGTRLDAVRDYALKLPSCNGKSASIGFCWGGGTSFFYATHQKGLNAAVVYYGTPPDATAMANINAPVLGLYGEKDNRVTSTVPTAEAEMNKAGKSYEYEIYPGAGHGFLRQQSGSDGANMKAAEKAWPRTIAFLKKHTQ